MLPSRSEQLALPRRRLHSKLRSGHISGILSSLFHIPFGILSPHILSGTYSDILSAILICTSAVTILHFLIFFAELQFRNSKKSTTCPFAPAIVARPLADWTLKWCLGQVRWVWGTAKPVGSLPGHVEVGCVATQAGTSYLIQAPCASTSSKGKSVESPKEAWPNTLMQLMHDFIFSGRVGVLRQEAYKRNA